MLSLRQEALRIGGRVAEAAKIRRQRDKFAGRLIDKVLE
jgi:hypothetical protein